MRNKTYTAQSNRFRTTFRCDISNPNSPIYELVDGNWKKTKHTVGDCCDSLRSIASQLLSDNMGNYGVLYDTSNPNIIASFESAVDNVHIEHRRFRLAVVSVPGRGKYKSYQQKVEIRVRKMNDMKPLKGRGNGEDLYDCVSTDRRYTGPRSAYGEIMAEYADALEC